MTTNNPKSIEKYETRSIKDENGDILIPVPKELVEKLKWIQGDTIQFGKDEKGRFILKKVN